MKQKVKELKNENLMCIHQDRIHCTSLLQSRLSLSGTVTPPSFRELFFWYKHPENTFKKLYMNYINPNQKKEH